MAGLAMVESDVVIGSCRPITDDCAEFLLEVLRFNLDEIDTLWFYSDWSDAAPREFAQRVQDLCLSRLLQEEPFRCRLESAF